MKRRSSAGASSAPASFATVARKVSGWTTNLLATGLILVVALGLGRQLIGWWRIEPDEVMPMLPADGPGLGDADASAPATLEFGDSPYAIERRSVRGDRAEALGQLLISCRQAAAQSDPPLAPPGDAEQQLLETVQHLQPLVRSGEVRFYGPDAGFPLLIAVAPAQSSGQHELPPDSLSAPENRAESLPDASRAGRRSAGRSAWRVARPRGSLGNGGCGGRAGLEPVLISAWREFGGCGGGSAERAFAAGLPSDNGFARRPRRDAAGVGRQ